MATKTVRPSLKRAQEQTEQKPIELPEVALAAIATYKRQKEVTEFINFLLSALARNSNWLNTLVDRQNHFKCALMVGAGPNRFQIQEIIYPAGEDDINLELEMKGSEDYDKIAITALIKLSSWELDNLLKYMKNRLSDDVLLRNDLMKGKGLGLSFAILSPMSEKHYRVTERINIGSSIKCLESAKKRRKDESNYGPFRKTRKISH